MKTLQQFYKIMSQPDTCPLESKKKKKICMCKFAWTAIVYWFANQTRVKYYHDDAVFTNS